LLKNGHLRRYPADSPSCRRGKKSLLIRRDATPHPSSLRRTAKYASLLRISGALHLAIFEQPAKDDFFRTLLIPNPGIRKPPCYFKMGPSKMQPAETFPNYCFNGFVAATFRLGLLGGQYSFG